MDLVLERKLSNFLQRTASNNLDRLIAIMLGRFRMTVPDCTYEYEKLGEEVFGKPRMLYTLRCGFGNRTKYKAADLERVFRDVAERRVEQMCQAHKRITFSSEGTLCRTLVLNFFPHAFAYLSYSLSIVGRTRYVILPTFVSHKQCR